MLSAQKEGIRLVVGETPDDLPNLGSFGKVVSSIQGLQERLESFSADDVGVTYDKTQTLLLRLSELQDKLARFVEINAAMAAAREAIEQASRDCAVVDKLDGPEKREDIQTFIQANNLIQFPRPNKSAKTAASDLAGNVDEPIQTRLAVQEENDAAIPMVAEDSDPLAADQSLGNVDPATLTLQPLMETATTTSTTVREKSSPQDQAASTVGELAPTTALEPLLTSESEISRADEVQNDSSAAAVPASCDANADERPSLTSPLTADDKEETHEAVATTTSMDFDQRLLDDLIKNYGEFVGSRSLSRTIEMPDPPAVDVVETNADPTARPTQIEFERTNLPTIKRDGDLDRQLKKLIKDYGEYDLYSRRSPINLKTGVIAAFLLLALIFSGFYYFSPNVLSSQSSTPDRSRHVTSDEARSHDNPANRPGATVAETGAQGSTESNSGTKSRP